MNRKVLGAAVLTVVALVVGGYRTGNRALNFQTIKPGQTLPGTSLRYVFQFKEVLHSDGTLEKSSAIILTDDQSHAAYPLPGNFILQERPGEFLCRQCVAILHQADGVYLVTRSAAEGARGTYNHQVINLNQPNATDTVYPSCGQVYRQGEDLVFPHLPTSCPSFWAMLHPQNWEYTHVPLANP